MEKEAAEKEGIKNEEIHNEDSNFEEESCQCEADDDCKHKVETTCNKSQDKSNPDTLRGCGIDEVEFYGSTAECEQASDEIEFDGAEDHEKAVCQEEEEDDDVEEDEEEEEEEDYDETVKEQEINGESGLGNLASGRRYKLKSSGSFSEQGSQSTFFSSQKSNVMSSGGRHKQTRRRNHHHHQQNRGRRRTGNQIILAFKEMLSESLSFWCISCIHMMIEIIVTLTHNCGVGVETGGLKLYSFGQQLLQKVTDIPGLKADANRILKWTKCTGIEVVNKIVRSVKWMKSAALSCFGLFCALVFFGSQWAKAMLVRVGGERGKLYWTAFQDSRFWKRIVSLLEKVQSWFRRDSHATMSNQESPSRAGRSQSGQELERLLALAEVPENELDPFTVLGVELHATEAELKKAYRQLAVQVCTMFLIV